MRPTSGCTRRDLSSMASCPTTARWRPRRWSVTAMATWWVPGSMCTCAVWRSSRAAWGRSGPAGRTPSATCAESPTGRRCSAARSASSRGGRCSMHGGPGCCRAGGPPPRPGACRRVEGWAALCGREIGEQPWRQVLNAWWPRLLRGVVAAATHGVIRVGHSVRALLADGDDPSHLAELAHGLAYWAARWQTLPGGNAGAAAAAAAGRTQAMTPLESLAAVPRIAKQSGGISDRLASLGGLPAWPSALAGFSVPSAPEQIRGLLAELVDAATVRYLFYGHGNGVMLVHSATAPSVVLRTLPALDTGLWAPSLAAAWAASSALTAVYGPAEPAPRAQVPVSPVGVSFRA